MTTLIYWTKHEVYYIGYEPDSGSLWCRNEDGALWFGDDVSLGRHLLVLTTVEKIPDKELELRKLGYA